MNELRWRLLAHATTPRCKQLDIIIIIIIIIIKYNWSRASMSTCDRLVVGARGHVEG